MMRKLGNVLIAIGVPMMMVGVFVRFVPIEKAVLMLLTYSAILTGFVIWYALEES